MIVLDSSALLALLFFEPGCERVAELALRSCMSTVNLAEDSERLARATRASALVSAAANHSRLASSSQILMASA